MAYQTVRGGVVSALGTSLSHTGLAPKVPRTLVWKDKPARVINLQVGAQLPQFVKKSQFSFGNSVTGQSKLNPFLNFGYQNNKTVLSHTLELTKKFVRSDRKFSTATGTPSLTVSHDNGNYTMVIPISGDQKCLFTINNQTTVKDFLTMLQEEDPAMKNIAIHSADGVKIAGASKLSDILSRQFQISLNGKKFSVTPKVGSPLGTMATQTDAAPADPRSYDQLRQELLPLYLQKIELDKKAERHANIVMYGGLAYLVAQWAFLARLTWWEFNWDIMEPVTYFVTFGTAVLGYFYFAVTRREYTFGDVRESILKGRMFKAYVKAGFPIEKYFALESKLRQIDADAVEELKWEVEEGRLTAESATAKAV